MVAVVLLGEAGVQLLEQEVEVEVDQIEQAFDTAEWSGKAEGSIATRVVVDPWG